MCFYHLFFFFSWIQMKFHLHASHPRLCLLFTFSYFPCSWFQGSLGGHWQHYSGHGLHASRCGGQLRNRGIARLHHHCPVFWISLPGMHADGQSYLPCQVLWKLPPKKRILLWTQLWTPNLTLHPWCFAFSEFITMYESLSSGKSVVSRKSRKQLVPGSEFPLHQENSNMCKKVFDSGW